MKLLMESQKDTGPKRSSNAARITAGLLTALFTACYAAPSNELQPPEDVAPTAKSCENLMSAKFPNTTLNSARTITTGSLQPSGGKVSFGDLPAFCRVTATVHPVPDSSIGIEVWLPATWNGRYEQVGNHGWAGAIHWEEMVAPLQRGFVTAATDDGHTIAPTAYPYAAGDWAFGHPAKIDDMAWRAVHVLAETAKGMIATYYGKAQAKSYFNGCSDGGREGLLEARDFPADFNGILVGGAGSYWTRMANEQLYAWENLKNGDIQGAAGAAVLQLAEKAAVKQCAKVINGVSDDVITDPRRCDWDPHTLVCKSGQDPAACITARQADALAKDLRPLVDAASGKTLFYGMAPGSELDQVRFKYNESLIPYGLAVYQVAFQDPKWDGSKFDHLTDLPTVDRALGAMNVINPDLSRFEANGGKLIEWQGWDDAVVQPEWITHYYDEVVTETGKGSLEEIQKFFRLFMMPGVGHCGVGPGPDNIGAERQTPVSSDPEHDAVSALVDWVEQGHAPAKIIATKFNATQDPSSGVRLQRPLCPYPAEAVWNGSGKSNEAGSFHCAMVPKQ